MSTTTIKDVAKHAGVSFKTVSRVMNNDPAVRDSTRERVLQSVAALNYRPNASARTLRSQRTHTIGFVSDEIGTSSFAGKILQGAQECAWQHDTVLLSVDTARNPDRKLAAIESLLNRQVEGIIYASMFHREVSPPQNLYAVPTVLLDCYVGDHSLPSVVPNEFQGGYTATHHLLEKGYRRIAMLNHLEPQPAATGRHAGYRQALHDAGLSAESERLFSDIARIDGGYRAATACLDAHPDIEALFCFNDRMALGAYQALNERGLRIPDDVAVVGFDNEPGFAEWFRPPLTTLALPHSQMGRWAVEHLLHMINAPGNIGEPRQVMLDCPLVERASTQLRRRLSSNTHQPTRR